MEPADSQPGNYQVATLDTPIPVAPPSKPAPRLTLLQRQELDRLYRQCPRPSSAVLQRVIKDVPALASLNIFLLKAWFQSRRYKEKRDEKLAPLISKNAELMAEHESLLSLNSQLRSQALLLNFENQFLKEELEKHVHMTQAASFSQISSSESVMEGCSSEADDGESELACEPAISDLESNLHKGDS